MRNTVCSILALLTALLAGACRQQPVEAGPSGLPYSRFEFSLTGIDAIFHSSSYSSSGKERKDSTRGVYEMNRNVICVMKQCSINNSDSSVEIRIDTMAGTTTYRHEFKAELNASARRLKTLEYSGSTLSSTGFSTKSRTNDRHNWGFKLKDIPYERLSDGSIRCTLDGAALVRGEFSMRDYEHRESSPSSHQVTLLSIPPSASLTMTLK